MLALFISAFIIIMVVATAVVCSKVRRCPMKMPSVRLPLMASSFVCAAFTAFSAVFAFMTAGKNFVALLTVMLGVLSAVLFVAYGFSDVLHIKINGGFFALPIVYGILRLVNIFITITSVASMWKNFLWALCECAQILFLLEFGKIASNINGDDYKKFLMIALSAIVIGATFTLPNAFLYLPYRILKGYSSNTMIASTVYCLGITLFETVFTFSFFANKNLKNHSNKKRRRRRRSSDNETNRFYMGDFEYHHTHHHHHHHSHTENSDSDRVKTDSGEKTQEDIP